VLAEKIRVVAWLLIKEQMKIPDSRDKLWEMCCLEKVKSTTPSLLSVAEVWGKRRRMRL
jgi:hypothetical protein